VKLTFTLETQPTSEQKKLILDSLDIFNDAQAGSCNFKEFTLFARSETGGFVGGLLGWTHWNHFFVCALFVDERARREGVGRELMKRAEELAVEQGCNAIYLDTFDFQAPKFYEKLGFKVFGTLQDYPTGHQRFYLVKQIRDSP
jgi:GNAT superfamily N-acetyltransferase